MMIDITLTNRGGLFAANGVYDGEKVIVKKGGFVNPNFATCIRGGKQSKKYRNDRNYVSVKYEIVKDCVFKSPSTAAQFVTGRSVSGYYAWKVNSGKRLGDYLKDKGLR